LGGSSNSGTGAHINRWGYDTEHHHWKEAVVTFRTWNNVEQALEKQIIMVFEPIYLEILNNDMVGFSNTTAREILEKFFLSHGSITAVDLEHNF
jgi:DNA-binding transcriptional regulator WhiA